MMGSTHLLDACVMHVTLLMVMRVAGLRTELWTECPAYEVCGVVNGATDEVTELRTTVIHVKCT